MDDGSAGPRQARARGAARAPVARALRPGWAALLRTGEVVSRRGPAALGALLLLARRRPLGLAGPCAHRRRDETAGKRRRRGAPLPRSAVGATRRSGAPRPAR